MQNIILLTVILSICATCISHPYPTVQNVKLIFETKSDGSDVQQNNITSRDGIFIELLQRYEKISEIKSSVRHESDSQSSSSTCGYEVQIDYDSAT